MDVVQGVKVKVKRERAEWGKGIEFLMSCIAISVGLGNIWRFPFTAYQNGGGAFLIPYIIVLVLIGRPMYYMEMCMGQFSSFGNVKTFYQLAPAFKGIGYGQVIGVICVISYYCSLVALTLFYLINSFTGTLPWSYCRDTWELESSQHSVTCIPSNGNLSASGNGISSSELYFRREVLKEKVDIQDGVGSPDWRLSLCLLFSYVTIYLITWKGVKSSGKAAYFLALFPYVIMLVLLIRAVTLDGAVDGILYFIKPDWEKLLDAQVWYAAVTQCFFSLGIGFGIITTYASYNNFNQNIYRDCLIVTTLDTFTSLLAGVTIFGILGHLAYKLDVDVAQVINSGGTGLAFISYPEAIAKFDAVPWLFGILFFFMLFVLGIGTLMGDMGVVSTAVMDTFPGIKTWKIALFTALVGMIASLIYVTNGGQFIFTLVDFFGGTMLILILTILETVVVFWWYGLENFCDDIEFMLKRPVGVYWRISWGVINPIFLIAVLLYFLITMTKLTHENRDFPDLALTFGWIIVGLGLLQIPIWWLYYMQHIDNITLSERISRSISHQKWNPADDKKAIEYREYKNDLRTKRQISNVIWYKRILYVLIGHKYY